MSPEQQTALEKPLVREVYLVEFSFKTTPLRASSLNQTVEWNGFQWIGLGAIAGISQIEESDGLESKALSFTLNAADPSWLAISVGSEGEYRGLPAKMYFCPLNENYQLIGEPEICWRGIMDTVSVGIDRDGEETKGQIVLKCETSAFGLKRNPALRMNSAQQRKRHPNDAGFDYLPSLISEPQLWMSANFQRQ